MVESYLKSFISFKYTPSKLTNTSLHNCTPHFPTSLCAAFTVITQQVFTVFQREILLHAYDSQVIVCQMY